MNPWLVVSAFIAVALLLVVAPVTVTAFREWRRPWRLVCPRAGLVAQIRVGPTRAALAELIGASPAVARCSLWPPLAECHEECLALPRDARRPMRRGEAPPRERADAEIRLIVVPLAHAAAVERVPPAIAELARGCGAALRLLRVAPPVREARDEDDRVVAYVDQETERLEREAREQLERAAAGLEGLAVEYAVRFGDATTEILEEAEEAGADLIALPVRQHDRRGRWRDRSTARRLRQQTTIPLLVVPEDGAVGHQWTSRGVAAPAAAPSGLASMRHGVPVSWHPAGTGAAREAAMDDDRTTSDCPFLQPARPVGADARMIRIYCRTPNGRVRVPEADERYGFCLPGRWRDCPVHQRHAQAP